MSHFTPAIIMHLEEEDRQSFSLTNQIAQDIRATTNISPWAFEMFRHGGQSQLKDLIIWNYFNMKLLACK